MYLNLFYASNFPLLKSKRRIGKMFGKYFFASRVQWNNVSYVKSLIMTRSDCSIHKIWSEANLDLSVLFCLKEGWIRRFLKVITTSSCICMPCYFKSCIYNYKRVSFIIINAFNHSAVFMNVIKILKLRIGKKSNICRSIIKRIITPFYSEKHICIYYIL